MNLVGLEKYVLDIDQWHTPATDYPESEVDGFRIIRKKYVSGVYRYWGLDGKLMFRVRKSIPITTLQEKRDGRWCDWMVNDPPNYRAMQIYAQHLSGRVLVAGLGLGLILHELAKNSNVKYVCCIEKSEEVLALVMPCILGLLKPEEGKSLFNICHDNFFDFIDRDRNAWDSIFLDLWVTNAQTKESVYLEQVLPTASELILRYPGTPLTFHGFQTISEIKPISEEMANLIVEIGSI